MPEKKKGKRMTTSAVRVTPETHKRMKTLADVLGMTMSEAIDFIILEHMPEIDEEVVRREASKTKLKQLRNKRQN